MKTTVGIFLKKFSYIYRVIFKGKFLYKVCIRLNLAGGFKTNVFNMETYCVPFLYNTTENNSTTIIQSQVVLYEVLVYSFFSAFIIITNLALVIGLKKTNRKLTLSQKLYIYLSLNNSIVGLVSIPYMFNVFFLFIDYCVFLSFNRAMMMYTFGMSIGTFTVVSMLRNVAIRKPFYKVEEKTIYGVLVAWNCETIMTGLVIFFTYHPKHTSYTLYCFSWLYIASYLLFEVLAIVTLNLWSKRILTNQVPKLDEENQTEKIKRKRNQKAVGILKMLTIVYTVCTLPLSFYCYFGVLLLMYKGDERLLDTIHKLKRFIHIPFLLCSGSNALVYMLKDKKIRRYYSCRASVRKNLKQRDYSLASLNSTINTAVGST